MIFKKEIINKLSKRLSLPYSGVEQDWDIEMADYRRIEEFLQIYKNGNFSSEEKIALMALILASYDDFLNEHNVTIDGTWGEIEVILSANRILFKDLIAYWSLKEEKLDDLFRITPLVRNIDCK